MKFLLAALTAAYLRRSPFRRGKKRLARLVGPYTDGVVLSTAYGFPIYTRFADNTNRICFEGRPDRVVDFMCSLPEGATVLDIGANQGVMAILAARTVGEAGMVLAFEPSLETAERLQSNQTLNKIGNIVIFQQAIGSYSATERIGSPDPLHSGGAHIGGGSEQVVVSPINEVPGIEKLLRGQSVYAKIDTEGYELEVLKGLQTILEKRCIQQIIIEIDDKNLRRFNAGAADIYQFLESYGFVSENEVQEGHYDEIFRLKD